jgi:ferrous iron transport protein A
MTTLDKLPLGQQAWVSAIEGDGAVVQRLYEMGLFEGEPVEVIGVAPLGDPIEIRLRDYRLSLRRQEAARITVTNAPPIRDTANETNIIAGQPFSTRIQ